MKISVVTTCFNSQGTIRDTIESILSQSGDFELEYIVTDAGSKDDTLKIISEYGDRIKLIDATGTNQSQGINLGLRHATGDIVAFLNADDVYRHDAISFVIEEFRSKPEKLWLVGQCAIIDKDGREFHGAITRYKNLLLKNYSYGLLLIENFICQPAVFLRREALEQVGYFSESENLVMDYEYWLRIAKIAGAPIIVSKDLAGFRRIEGTKSNTSYGKQFRDDMRVAVQAALQSFKYWWTIPFKVASYARTMIIYPFLYR
jgi:glycosyltransferase involved in cell wall biosynthesis